MTYYDYVNCINCGKEKMKIPTGQEKCPNCNKKGNLIFVDENNPEIEE